MRKSQNSRVFLSSRSSPDPLLGEVDVPLKFFKIFAFFAGEALIPLSFRAYRGSMQKPTPDAGRK